MFYILKEMENKNTLLSKELGRKYDSVLAFVREVQEIAEKIEGGNKFKRTRRDRCILRRERRESSRIDLEEEV